MPVPGKYEIINIGIESEPFGSMVTSVAPQMLKNGECTDATNLQAVQTGLLQGRLGSDLYQLTQAFGSFTGVPTEVRLITEYYTELGIPQAGAPGITNDGADYLVVFVNTNTPGGAIVVLTQTDYNFVKKWETNSDGYFAINGLQQIALVPETNLIPKARQAHGKLLIPLSANQNTEVWIENGIWYAQQLGTPDFDSGNAANLGAGVNIVVVDDCQETGQQNDPAVGVKGALAMAAWDASSVTHPAGKQTTAYSSRIGSYSNRIINRADSNSEEMFIDVMQQPTRDNTQPPLLFNQITIPYYARTSPNTQYPWASAVDIFYRPENQVADWDTDNIAPINVIPESRWGYEFVWQYADGTYSNPSADLWVGDMEFSALKSADATALHSNFDSGVYGEAPTGLVTWSDAISNATGTITVAMGSPIVNGAGTAFLAQIVVGDCVVIAGQNYFVLSIQSNTQLTLTANYPITGAAGLTMGVHTCRAIAASTNETGQAQPNSLVTLPIPWEEAPQYLNTNIGQIENTYTDTNGNQRIIYGYFIYITDAVSGIVDLGWVVYMQPVFIGATQYTQVALHRENAPGQYYPNGSHAFAGAGYLYKPRTQLTGYSVSTYFDSNSSKHPAASFETGERGLLQTIKSYLYDPSHPHYSDDVWMTADMDNSASAGLSYEWETGFYNWLGAQPSDFDPSPSPDIPFPTSWVDNQNAVPTNFSFAELVDQNNNLYRTSGYMLDCRNTDPAAQQYNGVSYQVSGVRNASIIPNTGFANLPANFGSTMVQVPNLQITNLVQGSGMENILTDVGIIAPYMIMQGYMDFEFFANGDNNASQLDQAPGTAALTDYANGFVPTAPASNPIRDLLIFMHYVTVNIDHRWGAEMFYSFRRLVPVKRLMWDWQLSQTFPASLLFNCPRVKLTIAATDVPTNAINLLIFRTLNSTDPAFNPQTMGLAATVPVTQGQAVTFFDNVLDTPTGSTGTAIMQAVANQTYESTNQSLDFSNQPIDYQSIRFGLSSQFVELKGERVFWANNTEWYQPLSPRAEVLDSADTMYDCEFLAVADNVNGFPNANLATAKYLIVQRDINNKTSAAVSCVVQAGSVGSNNFHVIGYFLGHGSDSSIAYLDVYRYNHSTGLYLHVAALTPGYGGVFYDGTDQTAPCALTGQSWIPVYTSNTSLGTCTVAYNSKSVTGSGTTFTTQLYVGATIVINGSYYIVAAIGSDTTLTLTTAYGGVSGAGIMIYAAQTFGIKNVIQDTSGIRFTEVLQPQFIPAINLQDVTKGDGEPITGLTIQKDNIIAFKPTSMHRMMIDTNVSNPQEERLETITLEEGCTAPCTLQNDNDILIYLSEKGVRGYNGTQHLNIDTEVRYDIQKIARYSDVEQFTSVWVPHYQQYWLAVNTNQNDVIVVNAKPILSTDTNVTLLAGEGATLPNNPTIFSPFTLTDGTNTDYGYIEYSATSDTVTMQRYGTTHNFAQNQGTFTVVNHNTYVYVFDLDDKIITRFLFPNRKIFMRGRDGEIRSGVTVNPMLQAGNPQFAAIMLEDGGLLGVTPYDGGMDARGNTGFRGVVRWAGKYFIGETSEHIKRYRRSRVHARIYGDGVTFGLIPFLYQATAINAGAEPGDAVPDAVGRYIVVTGGLQNINVDFVMLDVQRGLDFQPVITCDMQGFELRGIEIYYHLLRRNS